MMELLKKEGSKDTAFSQQIAFLKKISFFHDFDDNELHQFLSVSRWLKVPAGTEIIKEESTEKVFYILVKGRVSVFKTLSSKKEVIELTTLKTGDCFGEMSLVLETKRTAGVKTLDDSFILMVDPDIINTSNVFLQLKFYKRFCEILVSRLILANRRVASAKAVKGADVRQQKQGRPSIDPEPLLEDEKIPLKSSETVERSLTKYGAELMTARELEVLPSMPTEADKIGRTKLQRIITSTESLYPIHIEVVKRISAFLAKGETGNTRKFAELISLDPFLAARILQIANSSYFRRSNAIITVPHAMVTLGMDHIQTIVRDAIETSLQARAFSGLQPLYESFWRHCVLVGRVADLLKEVIRINIAADIYLAGLFHDFGIFPLDAASPNFYPQLMRPDSPYADDLIKSETDCIGIDHGKAGSWLAEKMGLPQPYLEVMQFHHAPEKARDHLIAVALVHLADLFVAQRGASIGRPPETDPLRSYGWIILQEQHKAFIEVNVMDFVGQFNDELDKTWSQMTSDLYVKTPPRS